jgi:hypothetical protein
MTAGHGVGPKALISPGDLFVEIVVSLEFATIRQGW